MKNNQILNKDLKTLIEKFKDTDVIPTIEKNYSLEQVKYVPLNLIDDNQFIKKAKIAEKNLKEYEENVKENGLIRPLIIRKVSDRYEIVIGRRLFIACKKLDFKQVSVIIENFDDEETLLILLADTLEQRSYNVIEVAYILKNLKDKFNYRNKDLAKLLKKSPGQISNILQLLNLPKEILRDIVNNKLTYGHAKAISRLDNEEALKMTKLIYEEKLNVREIEDLVNKKEKISKNCKIFTKNNEIIILTDSKEEQEILLDKINQLLKESN